MKKLNEDSTSKPEGPSMEDFEALPPIMSFDLDKEENTK